MICAASAPSSSERTATGIPVALVNAEASAARVCGMLAAVDGELAACRSDFDPLTAAITATTAMTATTGAAKARTRRTFYPFRRDGARPGAVGELVRHTLQQLSRNLRYGLCNGSTLHMVYRWRMLSCGRPGPRSRTGSSPTSSGGRSMSSSRGRSGRRTSRRSRSAGWNTVEIAPADGCPDAVFVEDALVVRGGLAVVTRPGAEARRAELETAEASGRARSASGRADRGARHARRRRRAHRRRHGLRRHRRAHEQRGRPASSAGLLGDDRRRGPVAGVLHLKTAVTALPDGTIVGHLPPARCRSPPSWPVPEESGAHVVVLDERRILIAADCPRSAELFASLGYEPGRRRHRRVPEARGLRDLPVCIALSADVDEVEEHVPAAPRVLAGVVVADERLVVLQPREQHRQVVVGLEQPELGEEEPVALRGRGAAALLALPCGTENTVPVPSSAEARSAKFTSFVTWSTCLASFP